MAQTAGQIGRMGFGGRGIAVGNALAGDASGFASPFYNPALAPYIKNQSLGLSAALMTQDRQLQFVELQTPLRPLAGIAAGLIHTGVQDIDQRNSSGYHISMVSTNEFAFFAAFGVRVGSKASIGVGLQLFRNDLHSDLPAVQTFGLDIGIGVHVLPSLHIGLVLDDLLAKYSWDTINQDGAARRSILGPSGRAAATSCRVRIKLFCTTNPGIQCYLHGQGAKGNLRDA